MFKLILLIVFVSVILLFIAFIQEKSITDRFNKRFKNSEKQKKVFGLKDNQGEGFNN